MASQAEARRVLRAAGHEVHTRGPLSDEQWAEYGRLTGSAESYEGGASAADFGQAGADEDRIPDVAQGGDAGAAAGSMLEAEAIPRPVGGQRQARRAKGKGPARARAAQVWGGRKPGAPRRRTPRDRGPWVPTAGVIESVWSQLAWAARPIPPIQKVLAAQAPMAGVALEDVTRGTFIDRVALQPAARARGKAEAVNAMLGPPLWTAAIAMFGGMVTRPQARPDGVIVQVPVTDDAGQIIWDDKTSMMIGGLRFSLMSWLKIGQRHSAEIIQQADELAALGREADELIAWILAPPEPGQTPREAEAEARARGASFGQGPRGPESHANGTAAPDGPTAAPSSAFKPARARGASGSRN